MPVLPLDPCCLEHCMTTTTEGSRPYNELSDNLKSFLYYPLFPYYPPVFSKPQVLPAIVREFVHFSYSLQSDSPPVVLEGMWLQFKKKGIVTLDMFQDERFSAHYVCDLFEPTMQSQTIKASSHCSSTLYH